MPPPTPAEAKLNLPGLAAALTAAQRLPAQFRARDQHVRPPPSSARFTKSRCVVAHVLVDACPPRAPMNWRAVRSHPGPNAARIRADGPPPAPARFRPPPAGPTSPAAWPVWRARRCRSSRRRERDDQSHRLAGSRGRVRREHRRNCNQLLHFPPPDQFNRKNSIGALCRRSWPVSVTVTSSPFVHWRGVVSPRSAAA